jgi:two-component system chemotaxis response regulator CheY
VKVLVADDSRVMRQLVIRTLRQAGYGHLEVLHASDGREAVDVTLREQPHLVLSDWDLPRLSGIDALVALRGAGITVPFGFVTAQTSREVRDRAAAAGAQFLIAKPFRAEDFQEALAGHLPARR